LAIEEFVYLTYAEAVYLHLDQMARAGETRCGVFERSLVESALARPQQAAVYENASLIRQAATLYFGLIKNHPWHGGNKRTASVLVDAFLLLNGHQIAVSLPDTIALVLAIEADELTIDGIETWLRERVSPL
jgi:death-on-curing protein